MATSQNGGLVLDYGDPRLITTVIPGTTAAKLVGGIAGVDLNLIVMYVGSRWNREIEPVIAYGCWGHNVRTIRGQSTGYSNHAAGEAFDINAPQHPLGTQTLTSKQLATLRTISNALDGVIRFGAFYSGRKDEMHGERDKSYAEVTRVANRIRAGLLPNTPDALLSRRPDVVLQPAPPVVPSLPVSDPSGWPLPAGEFFGPSNDGKSNNGRDNDRELLVVAEFQAQLRELGYLTTIPDGAYGPKTSAAAKAWQARNLGGPMQIIESGLCGWNDYQAIHSYARTPAQYAPGPVAPVPPAVTYPGRMIRYRDKTGAVIRPPMSGDDVLALQRRLNDHMRVLGQPVTGEDGKWGEDSDRVLRLFQWARHLAPYRLAADGVAGPATYAAL